MGEFYRICRTGYNLPVPVFSQVAMFPAFFKFRFVAALLAAVALSGAAFAAEGDSCDLAGTGDGREIVKGHCIPIAEADALEKCNEANWGTVVVGLGNFGSIFVSCQIPVRNYAKYSDSGGASGDAPSCTIYVSGNATISDPCESVFGAEFDFPVNDESGDQRFIYNCPEFTEPDANYVSGGAQSCVVRNEKGVCEGLFGGDAEVSGAVEVCAGIDANDTFCIVGAPEAFPCGGLFRHVSLCNFDHNRPALNPFFCGARCGENQVAKGANCSCAAGFAEESAGGPCVPESQ